MRGSAKPVRWIGSSRKDLKGFPKSVQRDVKALQGFGGRSVLEIVASAETATYRAIYTVRFADAVYVLHAFQKKSKKGVTTPKPEMDLIRQRLAAAESDYRERYN